MKKFFIVLGTLGLVGGVLLISVVFNKNTLSAQDSETSSPVSHEELHSGLWQEGQAVFSDVKALDILWYLNNGERFTRGYKPEQPVKFNHRIHVEKNHMECQYCHSGVAKSPFATIPSLELCMGCHKTVKTESEEIKKLKEHWEKKEPVEWVPVNNLPEHAVFTHERHIKAGVSCQTCHGMVQKMDVVERLSSFKMGFCVSCHRDKGASIDCATCHY